MLPALDLAYVKLVGRLAGRAARDRGGGARASSLPTSEYAGLAGIYALQRRFL